MSTREIIGEVAGYQPIGGVRPEGPDEPAAGQIGAAEGPGREWRFIAADGTRASLALLAPDLARGRLLPPGVEPARSWAVAREAWPPVPHHEDTGEDGTLTLTTAAMRVALRPDPFRVAFSWPDGTPFAEDDPALGMGYVAPAGPADLHDVARPAGAVRCHKRLAPGERILGGGEFTAPLDKRGRSLVYWNLDPLQPHDDQTRNMYAAFPFWLGLRAGRAYGIFLDTVWRADLDAGATRPDVLSFGAFGGDLAYYVFAGPTPAAVLARYADLTGHTPLPPLWALGYHQSRWSYVPEAHLRAVAEQLRARRIPCDALWLDIDYMDGYRVFTFSPRRYPDPARLTADLGAAGFKVVTIIDPGVKADLTDPTFAEGRERDYFVRRADGALFTGVVWPGESAFPDFSRETVRVWWGERHRALLDAGVRGIWDDMNEPSLTGVLTGDGDTPHGTTLPPDAVHRPDGPDGPPLPHRAFHNAYGMQMARATREGLERLRPDARPFVLTRAAYAGIQRYAAMWTGDNRSEWAHLRLAARMCLALGLAGVPFCGFDTGGFWGATDPMQLVRWAQLGATFPFFRNHSAMDAPAQEPWAFGQPYEALIREAIELRYRLLPYLYTTVAGSARSGAPIARPLIYAYPEEESLADVDDEHLLGGDLLCAPVVEPDTLLRPVAFPPGAWVDWQTGERVAGPLRRRVDAPLDLLPLFAREGAILPLGPVLQYVGERPPDPLTLACYLGPGSDATASGALYEDDGETPAYQRGAWRLTRFTARRDGDAVTVTAEQPEGEYAGETREWLIELHLPHAGLISTPRPSIAVARLGERDLDVAAVETVARRHETLLRLPLGRVPAPWTARITLAWPAPMA